MLGDPMLDLLCRLLKLGPDDPLEFVRVHGEPPNGFRHFFSNYRILVHLETDA